MPKVKVSQASALTGVSPPTLYKHMNQNKLPYSLEKGVKVIDTDVLQEKYGLVVEETSETIDNLQNHIGSLQDHIETLKTELDSHKNRADTLLRILDPATVAPIDIFLSPMIEHFKQ